MRTRGLIFASKEMIPKIMEDKSLEQVANVATLPGIVGPSMAMPDIHWGYGFPIGGVAAFDLEEGVVSPGGVGYDINCGVRLLRTNLQRPEVECCIEDLVNVLFGNIPSGVGSRRQDFKLTGPAFKEVMRQGARLGGEERLRQSAGPGPHRGPGQDRRGRPGARLPVRHGPGQGPVGHPGLGQPLRGSGLRRGDFRREAGRGPGAVQGPGDGHRPHRLPGAGAPGVRATTSR